MTHSMTLSSNTLHNTAKVMEFIYRNKLVSRTKISDKLNITPAATTSIVSMLIKKGIIFETGNKIRIQEGSGRSRRLLNINENFAYLIGVEFNVRGIAIVATDIIGKILSQKFIKMENYTVKNITPIIIQMIKQTLHQYSHERCAGIGFAIPGHFDTTNQSIISNNKSWSHFNFDKIKKNFELPIFIDNNIECMALAEYLFDSQESPDRFLFLHNGPGIFCSFFNSQHINDKDNYYIGELGHTIVDINGPICECGKRGCLQTYISDTWLIESAKFLFSNSANTVLKSLVSSPKEITLDVIIDAYTLGDSFIIDKIESGIQFLAISISNTLIIYDSNKIFINSELLNKLNFKSKLTNLIEEQLYFIPSKHDLEIKILDFNLYRGARGACSLAAYHSIIQSPFGLI